MTPADVLRQRARPMSRSAHLVKIAGMMPDMEPNDLKRIRLELVGVQMKDQTPRRKLFYEAIRELCRDELGGRGLGAR